MSPKGLALAAMVLALSLPARAQQLVGLRAQGLRCLQSVEGVGCKAFLQTSHRLKNQAESAKQLRCYTALLGYEAQVLAARSAGGSDAGAAALALDPGFTELQAECERIQ